MTGSSSKSGTGFSTEIVDDALRTLEVMRELSGSLDRRYIRSLSSRLESQDPGEAFRAIDDLKLMVETPEFKQKQLPALVPALVTFSLERGDQESFDEENKCLSQELLSMAGDEAFRELASEANLRRAADPLIARRALNVMSQLALEHGWPTEILDELQFSLAQLGDARDRVLGQQANSLVEWIQWQIDLSSNERELAAALWKMRFDSVAVRWRGAEQALRFLVSVERDREILALLVPDLAKVLLEGWGRGERETTLDSLTDAADDSELFLEILLSLAKTNDLSSGEKSPAAFLKDLTEEFGWPEADLEELKSLIEGLLERAADDSKSLLDELFRSVESEQNFQGALF